MAELDPTSSTAVTVYNAFRSKTMFSSACHLTTGFSLSLSLIPLLITVIITCVRENPISEDLHERMAETERFITLIGRNLQIMFDRRPRFASPSNFVLLRPGLSFIPRLFFPPFFFFCTPSH